MSHQRTVLLLFCSALASTIHTNAQTEPIFKGNSGDDILTESAHLEGTPGSAELTRESTTDPSFFVSPSRTTEDAGNLEKEPRSKSTTSSDNSTTWSATETSSASFGSQDDNWDNSPGHTTTGKGNPLDTGNVHNLTGTTVKLTRPTEQDFAHEITTEIGQELENDEDCVLVYVECVEPVRCKGQGKIDCSEQEKSSWEEDFYNYSLNDHLLPKEPRLRRSSNSKQPKGKRKFDRSRPTVSSNSQEEDYSSGVSCWVEDTLLCSSKLNLNNCRGVGRCDASPSDVTSTSLADWEIAVISVLTLAGVLLLGLLVYVIYGAWRKKRVQPVTRRNGSILS